MNATKEQVYDDEVSPLMGQILTICKRRGIAMFATFALDGDDLRCTSALPDESGTVPDDLQSARNAVCPTSPAPLVLTMTTANGDKTVEVIL